MKPTEEGNVNNLKYEAFTKPRVVNEFVKKYNDSPFPKDDIAINVLEEMGVPSEKAKEVLHLIQEGANGLGLITEIKGRKYLQANDDLKKNDSDVFQGADEVDDAINSTDESGDGVTFAEAGRSVIGVQSDKKSKRIFLTHGKNRQLVEPIKSMLKYGELEAVVSVELQSVSKPVPEKVMEDMRSCSAAIIHVEGETKYLDSNNVEQAKLNDNVLIEIGAAMALYGRRFILLVKDGTKLPSNLQGLYEVRYSGETLNGDETMKLLFAINELKKEKVI